MYGHSRMQWEIPKVYDGIIVSGEGEYITEIVETKRGGDAVFLSLLRGIVPVFRA